jgi:nucleoside-diphosphate-sugar epimerase
VRTLVTGAAGFICGYLVPELLQAGHQVIGIDNFSKYGPIRKSFDDHPNYRLVDGDAKDVGLLTELADECDQLVAAAAMIGGISYFHEFAYDLMAENERILAATFDAAIHAFRHRHLEKINVLSSSMVFESATVFPTPEGAQLTSPPPRSTYGFQKLASEYFAGGAMEQYQLPYTIIRPFNCVGVGERRALRDVDIMSGNVKLAPTSSRRCCGARSHCTYSGMGPRSATTPTEGTSLSGFVRAWSPPRRATRISTCPRRSGRP